MQPHVVYLHGSTLIFPQHAETENTVKAGEESDPGPIIPEIKELAWGAGSFVLFALLMRFVLFPKLKRGMDSRYEGIQRDHASADATRSAAKAEVSEYEAQLAGIRAEAARKLDEARQTLEGEREVKLAEVNARLNARRQEAAERAEDVRQAARGQIKAAVSSVAGHAGELATGRPPRPEVVDRVVSEVMAR